MIALPILATVICGVLAGGYMPRFPRPRFEGQQLAVEKARWCFVLAWFLAPAALAWLLWWLV